MKRKIIKLGTATLVASLPAKWIRQFGLKSGDYLNVDERKGGLILTTEKEIAKEEKKIDLRGINTKLATYYLEAAYCMGYDRIEILHDSKINEYKTHKKINTSEFIQKEVSRWIGIEIIEQLEEKTVLKDIGGSSENEADNIIRRAFLLTKDISNECVNALTNKDTEEIKVIESRAQNIFRFIYFYRRLLNKKGYKDFNKTAVMYQNTYILGDIVKVIQYIARETLGFKKKYSAKAVGVFESINSSIDKIDNLFFSFSKEKAMEIIEDREKQWEMMNSEKNKCTREDAFLYSKLAMIVMSISYLSLGRFYLEL